MRFVLSSWLLLFPAIVSAAIDPDLPSPAPVVRAIFPHGVQRGTSTDVEISGQNLHDATSVEFAGRGVRAEIVSSLGSKLKLKITADATAEVGRRDFRLTTRRGVYVGVFDIGAIPETIEKESNDDFRKPQPINLPVLVNGTLGNEDWDHFLFRAAAGESLIFDVSATRHGSRLDADVAILDRRGQELAWTDDTSIFGDPHLVYKFEKEGEYIVRVGSLAGGGDYRLVAGRVPYVTRALPAGVSAGKTTLVTLTGTHLDLADEVWIGDRAVRGKIIKKSPNQLQARFETPSDVPAGTSRVHVSMQSLEVAIPTEIRISKLPEITVGEAYLSLSTALPVTPSVILNGVIDQPKSMHYFRFTARAGDHYTFRSESMKLGYHLDPTLTLLDANGKKLVYADDPGVDERSDEYQLDVDLSYTFASAGEYYVGIRDGMHRGGDLLVYRLTVERMQPDFILELREPSKSFYLGQEDTIQVRVRRRAGWNTPVEVWAEDLPPGVVVDRQTVASVDSIVKDTCGVDRTIDGTIALLKCRVESSAVGEFPLKIKARGVMDGVTVERDAIVRYQNLSAGYAYGPMQVQRAQITVTSPPAATLSTPETLSIGAGAEAKLKVGVRRFGAAKDAEVLIRAKGLPSTMTIPPMKAPSTAKEVQLVVSASPHAASSPLTLEVVSPAGCSAGRVGSVFLWK